MSEKIDPGYGYELVPDAEVTLCAQSRTNGNQIKQWQAWIIERLAGEPAQWVTTKAINVGRTYRRRIDPGEGFRIVQSGEVIKQWDQEYAVCCGECVWFGLSPLSDFFNNPLLTGNHLAVRRKLAIAHNCHACTTPVPTCQWVKTSERLPAIGHAVLTNAGMAVMVAGKGLCPHLVGQPPIYCWLDATEPPAPVDEAEEAFEDWVSVGNPTTQSAIESFKAGFRAGKQAK